LKNKIYNSLYTSIKFKKQFTTQEKKNLINNQYISNHTLLNKIILLK